MHRDEGTHDEFEMLCSVPPLKVRRFRMRNEKKIPETKSPGMESLVMVMGGNVKVVSGGSSFDLGDKDVCYLGMDSEFKVEAEGPVDVILAEAPAQKPYPTYVKRFGEVQPVDAGNETYSRRVFTMIGEADPANRLIGGYVEGSLGNWTSFPPHRHDGKPEVYIYYGMGRKFGVQVVSVENDERAFVVREGDAVLFEKGYHPNVATPTVGMNFIWIISADPAARNLAVDFHPDYKDAPMGRTHLKID